ncbi:MAG: hypothetical protein EXR48_05140 [Dehalococcoidia bacterium]|nr:hypothetical protein [Dehalococcoidia bacterium]
MNNRRPLVVMFGHPDDESFSCGGSMAAYATRGVPVHIVCGTRGEVGEISDPALATPATLGEVREQELRRAARTMGAAEPIFLGFRDSGMHGTTENADPRCLHQAPPAVVVEKLVALIRRLRPGVIVTFDETGGYGHPDHIAIHRHATAAFWAAARKDCFPHHFDQGLEPWQTPKLYYTAAPRAFWQRIRDAAQQAGIELPRFLSRRNRLGTPDDLVSAEIDVAEFADVKLQAIRSHATQMQPNNPFTRMPPSVSAQFQSTEYFQRVWPPHNGPHETDLYTGIDGASR